MVVRPLRLVPHRKDDGYQFPPAPEHSAVAGIGLCKRRLEKDLSLRLGQRFPFPQLRRLFAAYSLTLLLNGYFKTVSLNSLFLTQYARVIDAHAELLGRVFVF